MLALLEKIRKIFRPKKQSKINLKGRASDLIFQCTNKELPCPRGVHNPLRKKKALRRCWGCSYLEFVVLEKKLRRARDLPSGHP